MFRRRSPRYLMLDDIAVPQKPAPAKPVIAALILIIGLATALGLWQTAAAEPQRVALDERVTLSNVEAGQLLFESDSAGEYHAAIDLGTEANFQISGMIAHMRVRQTFRNDSDNWLEGIYVFPLPETAALNALIIRIGERVIEGEIHEKKAAEEIYQQARRNGKKASLVEQERPNLFTNSIANIAPGEVVSVEIHYLQAVDFSGGVFSLRFPMTITPRYFPRKVLANTEESQTLELNHHVGWALATDEAEGAARISPPLSPAQTSAGKPANPIRVSATIDMGMPLHSIDSAYHDISVMRNNDEYAVSLTADTTSMTRDFLLSWQPEPDATPQAALFTESVEGEDYALLMLVPPHAPADSLMKARTLAKEQIFIIDTSGSMGGAPIEQAKNSLMLALENLQANDRFNIIEFNSYSRAFFPSPLKASSTNIERAKQQVRQLRAAGGTEMLDALTAALGEQPDDDYLRQVIFITDGAVGNEAALFKFIQENLSRSRLFTVGIGAAPNSYFMRKAARFGRGSFTHIGNVTEVGAKMNGLFSKLNNPLLRQIAIEWPANIETEGYPQRIPDLYSGEPLLLSVRLSALPDSISISGMMADQQWQRELSVIGNSTTRNRTGIATLWARQKLESLLDEIVSGRAEQDVKKEVLPLAMTHRLVSPYTSFVAVEKQASRPAEESLQTTAVANARPHGQALQSYAYPQGSTHAAWSICWGLLLAMLAGVFYFTIRKEAQHAAAA